MNFWRKVTIRESCVHMPLFCNYALAEWLGKLRKSVTK